MSLFNFFISTYSPQTLQNIVFPCKFLTTTDEYLLWFFIFFSSIAAYPFYRLLPVSCLMLLPMLGRTSFGWPFDWQRTFSICCQTQLYIYVHFTHIHTHPRTDSFSCKWKKKHCFVLVVVVAVVIVIVLVVEQAPNVCDNRRHCGETATAMQ